MSRATLRETFCETLPERSVKRSVEHLISLLVLNSNSETLVDSRLTRERFSLSRKLRCCTEIVQCAQEC